MNRIQDFAPEMYELLHTLVKNSETNNDDEYDELCIAIQKARNLLSRIDEGVKMTLDEAIQYSFNLAESNYGIDAVMYGQIAGWLMELKEFKEKENEQVH